MNSTGKPSEGRPEGADNAEPEKHDDTIMHSVARSVGTAIGVIASTATKVVGEPHTAETTPEPKAKPEKTRKVSKKAVSASGSENKAHANRVAKKKKKRAAHRKTLKRSNTKG